MIAVFSAPFSQHRLTTRWVYVLVVIFISILTLGAYYNSFSEGHDPIAYPLENSITDYNPYVQQFDAWQKGQLHFDYEPQEDFLALENPYDPAQRDGVYYLYDRAFFQGKYYSYFGVTPIVTVIFPYYAMTGAIPSTSMMQLVFMLIYAVFFVSTVFVLGGNLTKASPAVLSVLAYTGYVSSLQMLFARGNPPFYYIAATAAMAFLAAFAFFFFSGIFAKSTAARIVLFLFAGLAFTLCFHSRVSTAFVAIFFILPSMLWGIVFRHRGERRLGETGFLAELRRFDIPKIFGDCTALATFVLIGFIFAFAYNNARFGSPMDFGEKYQLTIADVSTYRLDINELGYALYYYFLAPADTVAETGAITLGYSFITDIGRYLYVDGHFGLFNVPFMLMGLGVPFIAGNKRISSGLRTTMVMSFFGCIAMAWIDFCLAGVIYRYLCDFSAVFAILAVVCVLFIFDWLNEQNSLWVRVIGHALLLFFCAVSIYYTFYLMAMTNVNLLHMDPASWFYRMFGA